MSIVTDRIVSIKRSGIRAILNLANEMSGDIVHLEIGQPHFPTPRHIVNAGIEAMKGGNIRYTKNEGIPEIRAKIAEQITHEYPGWELTGDNLLLSIGAVYGLAISISALINPGETVLIPDPGWPNYTMQIIAANGCPQYYPLRLDNDFKPLISDLEKAITPNTRIIIVNNPSNPNGSVLSESDCRDLLDFAYQHNITILSDEVYDKIIYGTGFTPMASLNHPASVITVNSFSKTYSMTGWRIGYVIADEDVCGQLVKMSEAYISCPPFISQKAAMAAITGPQDFVHEMVAYYRKNRDITAQALLQSGLPHSVPNGALYFMVDISQYGMDSDTFAKRLLTEHRVAVAPGSTFGPLSNRFIRLSICTETAELEKGLQRLLDFLKQIG